MICNISGFPEFSPAEQIIFDDYIYQFKNIFRSFGYVPVETSAVERASTLLSKGDDSEIYGIHRINDCNGKVAEFGLRFDLTVPLARFVSQNFGTLTFPFKRYSIGPVWRGERAQSGRYRQFYQCDIDVVGDEVLADIWDAEIISIIYICLKNLNIGNFTISINNRKILCGFLESVLGVDINLPEILRVIDKLNKVGHQGVRDMLLSMNFSEIKVEQIINFLIFDIKTDQLEEFKKFCTNEVFLQGLDEVKVLIDNLRLFSGNIPVLFNQSLARGLSYYTGMIAEVTLDDYPELGSIAGGGRYSNLTEKFCDRRMPGVGMSIGITRILTKLLEIEKIKSCKSSTAQVLVTIQNQKFIKAYIDIAKILREKGIFTDIFLENKKLGSQLNYANKKQIPIAVIANESELYSGKAIVRNMRTSEQALVSWEDIAIKVIEILDKNDIN